MPYRLLATNIPLHVTAEEFYDYVRAHAGGDAVVNALLITRPAAEAAVTESSCGAALVDYATKSAADTARCANFYVDGAHVLLKGVGIAAATATATKPAPATLRSAEAEAEEGREAYRQLQCGVNASHRRNVPTSSCAVFTTAAGDEAAMTSVGLKRPREDAGGEAQEMELRLLGIPCDVYGHFLPSINGSAGDNDDAAVPANGATRRSAVDLFADVALSV
ncbi:hypothetical protein DQ04_23751000, partial [Trypanosoma grayi]|uniref:hypothetical protein n=1 Tax=Trypanosoma grayi TaxID=71804 RepID=UPI0004F4449D